MIIKKYTIERIMKNKDREGLFRGLARFEEAELNMCSCLWPLQERGGTFLVCVRIRTPIKLLQILLLPGSRSSDTEVDSPSHVAINSTTLTHTCR